MRFLHDDKSIGATLRCGRNQTKPGQQNQKDDNAFHEWLDGRGAKILPINAGCGAVWWGEATDEPAREDARPTESFKMNNDGWI